MVTWFTSDKLLGFLYGPLQAVILYRWLLGLQLLLAVSADCYPLLHQLFSKVTSHTVQYCCNLCLKGYSTLSQWDVPLCFALTFANSSPGPLLITDSVREPDLPFSQPIGPVFVPLLLGRYHSLVFTKHAHQDYEIFYHAELKNSYKTYEKLS